MGQTKRAFKRQNKGKMINYQFPKRVGATNRITLKNGGRDCLRLCSLLFTESGLETGCFQLQQSAKNDRKWRCGCFKGSNKKTKRATGGRPSMVGKIKCMGKQYYLSNIKTIRFDHCI